MNYLLVVGCVMALGMSPCFSCITNSVYDPLSVAVYLFMAMAVLSNLALCLMCSVTLLLRRIRLSQGMRDKLVVYLLLCLSSGRGVRG